MREIDSLFCFQVETAEFARCGNLEIRRVFPPMAQLLLDLARDTQMFYILFRGAMSRFLFPHEQSPKNGMPNQVAWITGDAAPPLLTWGDLGGIRNPPSAT